MSGGHFDYQQYKIDQIADQVEQLIINNSSNQFSAETLAEFAKGLLLLKQAAIYAQRIDWLVSGDDGEIEFHSRLRDELNKIV